MKQRIPNSPFATRLSGSAKETELRIRNIFQWKKKRPPVILMLLAALIALSCGGLVSCQPSGEKPSDDLSELSHLELNALAQGDVQPIQPFQQAETKVAAVISLADIETYTPVNMEPDTVSADTMGDILCEKTLPGGTRVVCYWEPGSEYTKYWAIRQGDSLLRFCREDSGYGAGSYDVEPFTGVLGYDGFRIHAARGAAYDAYDYYIVDEDGVPRLLADCANQVLETDADGDGETELIYFYHDGELIVYYFRLNGQVCQADITETLREQDGIQARAENVESWTDSNFPVSILRDASALPSENTSWQRAFLRFTPETIELHREDII